MTMYDAVDLYAGPGGWDVAARDLGLNVLGIEWDKAACATRDAAGLPTVRGDVRDYGPARFPARGLIASPPCQAYSTAGKGAGRAALDRVVELAEWVAATGLAPARGTFPDERIGLVLEPLRWVVRAHRDGRPYEWIAWEQVPTVLPFWQACAVHLQRLGYHTATGYVHAEQYGVPQTRKRAVLVARLDRPVGLPAATHSRYHARTPGRLDPGVLPWVSMADALGVEDVLLRSNYGTGGDPAARGLRAASQPAATITSKAGRAKWVHERTTPPVVAGYVTPAQAAALQTFPPDYPWQGTKTQVFQQIGNAVPPRLASAILATITTTRETP